MPPLTFREVSANEEASGRYFIRRRPALPCPARDACLAAERHAIFPCPLCGQRTRTPRIFTSDHCDDAQGYAMCYNCGHMEGI